MKNIKDLLERLDYTVVQGSLDGDITELVYDSRKVTKDCIFVCMKGATFDSHSVAADVVANGAKVLVVEADVDVPEDTTVVKVADTREAL